MKKILMIILALALGCCGTATAESGRIDDKLFNTAKQALYYMDIGDYQAAGELLVSVDAQTLRLLAEQNFTTLGSGAAQTRISVAFYVSDNWFLAVPTAEPSMPEVEALVLNCGIGDGVLEARFLLWGDVELGLDAAEAVIWNEEYIPGVFVIEN